MRVRAWMGFGVLLFCLLAGCGHKADTTQTQVLAPPIEDKPLPPPSNASAKDLPPPVLGDVKPAPNDSSKLPPTTPPPHRNVHHKPRPSTDQASNSHDPGSVSAIGQLSSGGDTDSRTQTETSIAATERGLNRITRNLSDSEQKTAAQIRVFLKQAREALLGGDTDGAHTLAEKAHVLLGELHP